MKNGATLRYAYGGLRTLSSVNYWKTLYVFLCQKGGEGSEVRKSYILLTIPKKGHELLVRIVAMTTKHGQSPSPQTSSFLVQDQQLRTGSVEVKKLGVVPHQAEALAPCWWKRINIVTNTPLHGMRM